MKKILFIIFVVTIFICSNKMKGQEKTNSVKQNDWISLTNSDLWKGYNKDSLPSNWKIENGIIECYGKAGDMGGDIITKEYYDNFELCLEWKISPEGNSGIFYHAIESKEYHSPYQTCPEYQLLDDVGFPGKENLGTWQLTGANYAMHEANDKKKLKPVGEWNTSRVVYNNKHVEHWLNGEKVVEFEAWTSDWFKRKAKSKWAKLPHWGMSGSGHIGLQDHGAGVWFRKVRIRKL